MKKSTEFIKERAAHFEAQKRLHDTAEKEKRDLNETETQEFRDLQGKIEALNEKIKDAQAYEENLRMMGQNGPSVKPGGEEREADKVAKRYSLHRALDLMAEGRALDGVEKEMHDEAAKQARSAGKEVGGLAVPTFIQKRFAGQSVTQDAGAFGAALVDTDVKGMVDFLRPKPVLESIGAQFLTDLAGDAKFLVNNGGIAAAWDGEVDAGATSKNEYTSKTMKPKRLVAVVPISIQNLRQASIDLEAYTLREIQSVMANAIDSAAINGAAGGDNPVGILNTTGVNTIALGTNGAALDWPNIVSLETKVFIENAQAAKMSYLINPVTKGKLKSTAHAANTMGYLMSMDNTINGYPVGVSNLVPGNISKGTGTNLSAAIFGDFSQLIIGQWGFMDIVIDKSTAASGYYNLIVNGYYDVLVRQPKAFTHVKDVSNA